MESLCYLFRVALLRALAEGGLRLPVALTLLVVRWQGSKLPDLVLFKGKLSPVMAAAQPHGAVQYVTVERLAGNYIGLHLEVAEGDLALACPIVLVGGSQSSDATIV